MDVLVTGEGAWLSDVRTRVLVYVVKSIMNMSERYSVSERRPPKMAMVNEPTSVELWPLRGKGDSPFRSGCAHSIVSRFKTLMEST